MVLRTVTRSAAPARSIPSSPLPRTRVLVTRYGPGPATAEKRMPSVPASDTVAPSIVTASAWTTAIPVAPGLLHPQPPQGHPALAGSHAHLDAVRARRPALEAVDLHAAAEDVDAPAVRVARASRPGERDGGTGAGAQQEIGLVDGDVPVRAVADHDRPRDRVVGPGERSVVHAQDGVLDRVGAGERRPDGHARLVEDRHAARTRIGRTRPRLAGRGRECPRQTEEPETPRAPTGGGHATHPTRGGGRSMLSWISWVAGLGLTPRARRRSAHSWYWRRASPRSPA